MLEAVRLVLSVLAVAILGCGGAETGAPEPQATPDCVSACGLLVFGVQESCGEVDAIEASLVSEFSDLWPEACGLLAGVALQSDPERLNALGYGDLVEPHRMSVTVDGSSLRTGGAFVHAFVHVMDWRDSVGQPGLDHAEWEERHLITRINDWHFAQQR